MAALWAARACTSASTRFSATSRKNAVFRSAAWSKVSGGTSLVLARPGAEALAMKAMPHEATVRFEIIRTDFPLNRSASFMRGPCKSLTAQSVLMCQSSRHGANHFHLSGTKSSNTKKLSSFAPHKIVIARCHQRRASATLMASPSGTTCSSPRCQVGAAK